MDLKKPTPMTPILSTFFQTFGDFAITRKLLCCQLFFKLLEILLSQESSKVFRLGDINENVSGYGNHN